MPGMNMPIDPMIPDLSDLGFGGQDSESNSVGSGNEKLVLDDLLADSRKLKSPEARVLAIEDAQRKLAAEETPNQLDKLLQPGSLLKLLGAGIAASQGQWGLGAGIATGTVGKAGQLAAEGRDAKRTATTGLQEQHDKALDRIDKQQNRITQMMVANPDSLEGIDPVTLGVLATGRELPLDPTSKRAQLMNTDKRKYEYELMVQRLGKATTDQDRRTIIDQIETHMGWEMPVELKTAMSHEVDGDYMKSVNKNLMTHVFLNPKTGQTGLDTFTRAAEANDLENLYKYVGDVSWTEEEDSVSIPDETWALINRMNQWWKDPTIDMATKLETGGDLETIAGIVFADEPGSLSLLQSKLSATAPWLTGMDAASIAFRANGQLNQIGQLMEMADFVEGSDEEKDATLRSRTGAAIQQTDDARRGSAVANAGDKIHGGALKASEAVPGYSAGVYLGIGKKAMDRAEKLMKENSTAADFEREYNKALAALIASLKARKQ